MLYFKTVRVLNELKRPRMFTVQNSNYLSLLLADRHENSSKRMNRVINISDHTVYI